MKRIFPVCVFVLGLSISILASHLPANSQSDRNIGDSGNLGIIANSDVEVFENPTEGNNIPLDVAIKGESGLSPRARQQGANAFCQSNQYNKAVNFEFKRGSTIGTMQWNKQTNSWEFCESCTMYLTKVTCQ